MYFGHGETLAWLDRVAELARTHPVIADGRAELFVLPTFPALVSAAITLTDTGVSVGAQDLFWEDKGPYTGEVSGTELREIGCTYVEVGHAERRRYFGETDEVVSAKTSAAFRNGLTPILCLGELQRQDPERAAEECIRQLDAALSDSRRYGLVRRMLFAYEPVWAIGVEQPAGPDHIRTVCSRVQDVVASDGDLAGSRVIYGGSAGSGLLADLGPAVNGLFLGRFSHNVAALAGLMDEVGSLQRS
jgi:triosephosphate isomerase